eukprot:CAMPEP_0168602446 /NCGR_PEP_ID=MMETSP0420-20121227/14096_1 /TAXON_ID=498008 /ORGANISM="Pessonella sp." /LENGTH=68 /DNA_ID=CAMNT_0008641153 /DNA_START=70 /DNA_END=276 /DNA_ORIENTATION=-
MRTELSPEPVAISWPLGDQSTDSTSFTCVRTAQICLPERRSHTNTTESSPPVVNSDPSVWNPTAYTGA